MEAGARDPRTGFFTSRGCCGFTVISSPKEAREA